MRIIVSGGGTGGHIYPALALVREIKKQNKDAEFLYIGTEKGLESKIVARAKLPFESIEISGFKRKLSLDNIKTIAKFFKSISRSKKIIKEFKPDIVIGTGGYVCGPVVYAAARLGIPTIIHEQNSIPGLTNKFLSKFASKIAISFESSREYFPEDKLVYTGNPRASEVIGYESNPGKFNPHKKAKTVLVFGGSRGAAPINKAVIDSLGEISKKDYQLIYITGEVHFDKVKKEISDFEKIDNVTIEPFIHNMPELLASVDLVVARSGATTLAELTALGLPSILIPSPYVTNNHQEKNARALSDKGAARLLLEKDLSPESLITNIDQALDSENLRKMRESAKELGSPNSATIFYELIQSVKNN